MLSRTAADLYWMSRYLERAENLARMLEVSYSLSLMPQAGRSDGLDELAMSLLSSGTLDSYLERHQQLDAGRMLHFFALDEEPILQNVPTFQCRKPDELSHVLANLAELVVKETQGSGGYGMLVGPAATAAEIEDFRQRIKARPHAYIAQPTLSLSTCPTFVENGIAPRHIDLRPFVLSGKETRLVPGGLTRVALKEGSLIVNSSQGGGTKDTWVVEG